MSANTDIRPADRPGDTARLRAFIGGELSEERARGFDAHLARPRYRPAFTLLAERGGEIAGYALLGHERRRLGAATLEAGRLEHVFVRPADRRQGMFTALMGAALRALYDEGLPFALLCAPLALAASFGFAPYRYDAVVALPERLPAGRPLVPEVQPEIDELAALFDRCYGALALSQERALPDWRALLADSPPPLTLRDRQDRLVGYVLLAPPAPGDGGALRVAEAAAADSGSAAALLAGLGAAAASRPIAPLDLPPGHLIARAALQLGGELRLRAAPSEGMVEQAGVVDIAAALAALAPELERHLAVSRYAGWSGAIGIETDDERVTLVLADGRADAIDGSRPADVRLRRAALPALTQLLLGYRDAADLRAAGGLDCDDQALGLFDALFPVVL
jgi:GNAT superfamily N-acetyltransferase